MAYFETHDPHYLAQQVVFEGCLAGKYTGEFAGIPATGKTVWVPMCTVYQVKE